MFTGIVERMGRVTRPGRRLAVETGWSDLKLGESIAVSGVCLTVARSSGTTAEFDLVAETVKRTTLGRLGRGDRVNLERALRAGDRLGGHIVQGHVDGAGRVVTSGDTLRVGTALASQLVPKGSIAVDGVSLTIVDVEPEAFTVALIPTTRRLTTLGHVRKGAWVNLEVDILTRRPPRFSRITREFLARAGFAKDPPTIVVAPNAFKETFSPSEAARLIARGLRRAIPDARLKLIPVADGGDGTLEALRASLGGRKVHVRVTGPLGKIVRAFYLRAGRTAVIEMAKASGLHLVPPKKRDPLVTTTRGTGELIVHAWKKGARRILVGVGGSATVDGGAGALEVVTPEMARHITVLCDVENPLLGPHGAAAVFGPQKGATPAKVRILQKRLTRWARILLHRTGVDVRRIKHGGAAGGLSGGLAAFGARLVSGAEIILREAGFPCPCDFTVTGEGCIDRTSLEGKAVGTVIRLSPAPVVLVCGRCELPRIAFETGERSPEALVRAAERAGEWIQARWNRGR